MGKEISLIKVKDCVIRCDVQGFEKSMDIYLKGAGDEEACLDLSTCLSEQFSTINAVAMAKLMEIMIRKRLGLGLLDFPQNTLFRLAVLHGSVDLYECYIEEAIEPFLKGKTESEVAKCYMDLYTVAYQLNEKLFQSSQRCVKGMHFNSPFGRYEKNENVLLINQEDYVTMNDVVERYNSIVGRRDILKDLDKRMVRTEAKK